VSRAILVAPLGFLVGLEIYHCIRKRGWRFTLGFFLSAILFGIIRGNVVGLISLSYGIGRPYTFAGGAFRLGYTSLVEPFGWAFALYGSWFLAEAILSKLRVWRGEVLPVAFVTTLLMGAFSYAVEAAATPMGWWHWEIIEIRDLFFYAVPVVGIMDWASVGLDFFLPFLLVQVPAVKRSRWRFALGLIFTVHMLTHLVYVEVGVFGALYGLYHYLSVWALGAAALFLGKTLKTPGRRTQIWGGDPRWLDVLPFISVAGMLGIITYGLVGISGDLVLLFSVLPLAVALVMALPGVPLWPFAVILAAATLFDLKVAPALLVAASPLVYRLFNPHRRMKFALAPAAILVAAGFVAYFPWAHWRYTKMDILLPLTKSISQESLAAQGTTRLERRMKAVRMASKFAGGKLTLIRLCQESWEVRNREVFDFTIAELRSFGFGEIPAERLWSAKDKRTFNELLFQSLGLE